MAHSIQDLSCKKPVLYGVGVGPGDPELLTIKAINVIQKSNIIAFPAPLGGESFAYRIAKHYCNPKATLIPCSIAMRPGPQPLEELYIPYIAIIEKHLQTESVCFLCEGDPLFYGSFQYILHHFKGQYPISIIPGITSVHAGSALLQKASGSRNSSFCVVAAPSEINALSQQLHYNDNIMIIKIGRYFKKIYYLLEELQLIEKSYLLEYITIKDKEKIISLGACNPDYIAPYFSLIVVNKI